MEVIIVDDIKQEFNGVVYVKNSEGYYFHGKHRLHRDVWTFHHGAIPKGHVVHHRDLNPANNDISNLQCITRAEHAKIHADIAGTTPPLHKKVTRICDYCGKEFIVRERSGINHFCSEACAVAYKYRCPENQEIRICLNCGKSFVINKYSKAKCCSVSCGQRLRFKGHSSKKICPVCGKEFETISSKDNVCCSHKCGSILLWQTKRAADRAKIRQCEFCGKDFVAKNSTQRFCSKSCVMKARNKKD